MGLSVAGMVAIVQAKQYTNSKHMYSVHSWTGAITLFLFGAQVGRQACKAAIFLAG